MLYMQCKCEWTLVSTSALIDFFLFRKKVYDIQCASTASSWERCQTLGTTVDTFLLFIRRPQWWLEGSVPWNTKHQWTGFLTLLFTLLPSYNYLVFFLWTSEIIFDIGIIHVIITICLSFVLFKQFQRFRKFQNWPQRFKVLLLNSCTRTCQKKKLQQVYASAINHMSDIKGSSICKL